MSLISIKIDPVAALRWSKRLKEPDPTHTAVLAELAGADGICAHLREDRRYIRDRDIYILKETVKSKLTVQIAPSDELVERVVEVKPYAVTLMPFVSDDTDNPGVADIDNSGDLYASVAETLREAGISVAYFIAPEIDAVKAAAKARVNAVEFSAFEYVGAASIEEAEKELDRLEQMAQLASKLGLTPNCGGSLNYRNVRPLIDLGVFEEFTVGHAVISRGLMVGVDRAVREIIGLVHKTPEIE